MEPLVLAYSQTFQSCRHFDSPVYMVIGFRHFASGLTLLPSGVLSGIPTTAGTFKFKIRVVDSSASQKTVQKDFTW